MRRLALIATLALVLVPSPALAEDFEDAIAPFRIDIAGTFGGGGDAFAARGAFGLRATAWPNRMIGGELLFIGWPALGSASYTPLTLRFQREQEVVPDISHEQMVLTGGVVFSPLLGRFRVGYEDGEIGLHLALGGGVTGTHDDTAIVRSPCDGLSAREQAGTPELGCHLVDQVHPAVLFGFGLRAVLPRVFLLRLDVSQMLHPEQVWLGGQSVTELKHPVLVMGTIGISIPVD